MLARSLLIMFLSMPATVAIVATFLVLTPVNPAMTLPSLLMFFPVWIVVACGCYLLERKRTIAVTLLSITAAGFSVVFATKHFGIAGI